MLYDVTGFIPVEAYTGKAAREKAQTIRFPQAEVEHGWKLVLYADPEDPDEKGRHSAVWELCTVHGRRHYRVSRRKVMLPATS